MKKFKELRESYLEEKLKASDPAGTYIHDFVHSDNPKFAGKSKAKRIQMALAASYAAKGKSRNEEVEEVDEGILGSIVKGVATGIGSTVKGVATGIGSTVKGAAQAVSQNVTPPAVQNLAKPAKPTKIKVKEDSDLEEGMADTAKNVVKKIGKALTGGSDEDQRKDLQRKMGLPQTGKKPQMKEDSEILDEEKPGLYANIHAKQRRIAAGSGEHMRKPGSKGAPTANAFKDAAKTAKK
jgi:hypothetical protein